MQRHRVSVIALTLALALVACSTDQPLPNQPRPNPTEEEASDLPKAALNQEAYDRAMHKLIQDRTTDLSLTVLKGGEPAGVEATPKVHRSPHDEAVNDTPLPLDPATGQASSKGLAYPQSWIMVELPDAFFADEGEAAGAVTAVEEGLTVHWLRPGAWYDALAIAVDVGRWDVRAAEAEGPRAAVAVTFPKGAEVVEIHGGLGRLLGGTLSGDKLDDGTFAAEVSDGRIVLRADMRAFFKDLYDNHSTPPEAGDLYDFDGYVEFAAPKGVVTETPSADEEDPAFTPKQYKGTLSASHGNPYLRVPETEPVTTVKVEFTAKVKLTAEMLGR